MSAWWCLRTGREAVAGAILGLLVYKPQLLAPVLAVLCVARAWRLLVPAILAGAAEILATVPWIGLDGLRRYVLLVIHLPSIAAQLLPKLEQSHGLNAFWTLLVPNSTAALALYALTGTAVVVLAAMIWRRETDPSLRMSTLVVAVALTAPHLVAYDLTMLAPVWVWLVDWFLSHAIPATVGRVLYAGYLAPLAAPIVPFIHIQPSIPCFVFLLVALWRYRDAPRLALNAA